MDFFGLFEKDCFSYCITIVVLIRLPAGSVLFSEAGHEMYEVFLSAAAHYVRKHAPAVEILRQISLGELLC